MADKRAPHVIIADLAMRFRDANDAAVVEALAALPALADESDPCWNDESYWHDVAYPFLALADVSAQRRLEPAVRMLLDRACYGDPGEIMRGLRHSLEAITAHDWDRLAVLCIDAAQSDRLGTQLWALDQLAVLEDPRARPVFERALTSPNDEIVQFARMGLERLTRQSAG